MEFADDLSLLNHREYHKDICIRRRKTLRQMNCWKRELDQIHSADIARLPLSGFGDGFYVVVDKEFEEQLRGHKLTVKDDGDVVDETLDVLLEDWIYEQRRK